MNPPINASRRPPIPPRRSDTNGANINKGDSGAGGETFHAIPYARETARDKEIPWLQARGPSRWIE